MEPLVNVKMAAEALGVSPEFVKRLYRQGLLRAVHLGRAVRIPLYEIERLAREGVPRRQQVMRRLNGQER
jgi:excisionase family DNA binding protein